MRAMAGARKEVDNLKLHRQMYERRLRLLKEREGLTDSEIEDTSNDPNLFDLEEVKTEKE